VRGLLHRVVGDDYLEVDKRLRGQALQAEVEQLRAIARRNDHAEAGHG
jgi:hypothetical protein